MAIVDNGSRTAEERASNGAAASVRIILSFDVEEHHRIEAAVGVDVAAGLKAHYDGRVEPSTRWIVDELAEHDIQATFFIVGELARNHPKLIRAIHKAGHEVASHSWEHMRLHFLSPAKFRQDLKRSKDALEQITGEAVVGYRAPTFSVMTETAWAVDALVEEGLLYDSSIYPIRHDRYGVPEAPRAPFHLHGSSSSILELPPATLRIWGENLPVGGGGYFRVLPSFLLDRALARAKYDCHPAVAMLYFHPWEFDPRQQRLPMRWRGKLRTYAGIFRSQPRFSRLLGRYQFLRAVDVAKQLVGLNGALPSFAFANKQ